ncbi:Coronatine-insensitive 1-like protein [Dorcoceras hygrometricum]|uniref:Coronatine-insensitive 1-like protein n=1 Tax=Dorcoceras hygrometricum TaxID=472368 RepID=A0A2Z7CTU2_9LAMI|nr:Coronatine-insensitive 1-like protein [Dorcoceras hygrometricum]
MSLFDLQDVCIAIRSIATLDLPMVVDVIGIYGLKGQYCTLTTTNWFLQALSEIPRGSWGDVARRFYHDPLGRPPPLPSSHKSPPPPPLCAAVAATCRRNIVPANLDEENPSAPISSGLLIQADKGISSPVLDLIDVIYRRLP